MKHINGHYDRRWLALLVLCMGDLMIVLDTTIVNVALPSIRADLGFTETSLAWVVNAYLLTFGGFLLLGGRLGDFFGHRRLFLIGISLFALASPHGWIALAMPVLMLHFLINVTGLKATEEQALRSKGERYRLYQARTSGFIPWFPRRIEQ